MSQVIVEDDLTEEEILANREYAEAKLRAIKDFLKQQKNWVPPVVNDLDF